EFECTGRFAGAQVFLQPFVEGQLFPNLLFAAFSQLLSAVDSFFKRFEILEQELGVNDLDVTGRVDASGHVNDVFVRKATHDVDDGVDLPDVREKLIAEALPFGCPRDEPGNVDELDRRRHDPGRVRELAEPFQSGIRHRNHPDVGFDRTEWIIRGFGSRATQCVKKGGLTNIRQPDDAAAKRHFLYLLNYYSK